LPTGKALERGSASHPYVLLATVIVRKLLTSKKILARGLASTQHMRDAVLAEDKTTS